MNYFNLGYYSTAILFTVIGILIISPIVFIPIFLFGKVLKIIVYIFRFLGIIKQKKYKSSNQVNFSNILAEGRIVDLGEHIGILTKIHKKQIAEEYLKEQKTNSKKKQDGFNRQHKEKSYSERMQEAMEQEAQAKGWN